MFDAHWFSDINFRAGCSYVYLFVLVRRYALVFRQRVTVSVAKSLPATYLPGICKHTHAHTHSDKWLWWVVEHVNA